MAEVLSQNEIDALLSAVSSGDVETQENEAEQTVTQTVSVTKKLDWVAYDLTSQEKFVRGRLVALEGIHERFCRKFRTTLLGILKKNVSVTYRSTEFLRFGEYLTNLVLPTSLNIVGMKEPLGNMVFVVGSKLAYALVDAYYGGTERPFSKIGAREEFTRIEKQLIKKVVTLAIKDLQSAWKLNYPIELEYSGVESNPHFVGSVHGSESVAVVNFEVEFENLSGPFVVVVPLRPLESIRRHLAVNVIREVDMDKTKWAAHWERELEELELHVTARLGECELPIERILNLQVGEVLTLDQDSVSPISVQIEGQTKLKGHMGTCRGSAAVKVSDVWPFEEKES